MSRVSAEARSVHSAEDILKGLTVNARHVERLRHSERRHKHSDALGISYRIERAGISSAGTAAAPSRLDSSHDLAGNLRKGRAGCSRHFKHSLYSPIVGLKGLELLECTCSMPTKVLKAGCAWVSHSSGRRKRGVGPSWLGAMSSNRTNSIKRSAVRV